MNTIYRSGKISLSLVTLVILTGLIGGCSSSTDIEKKALTLLQQTEEQYNSLESFRLDAEITTDLDGGGRQQTIDIPLTYSVSKPGKMRLEVRHERAPITMISNGSVTWTYNPTTNQYSRTEASILTSGGDDRETLNATDQQFLQLARSLIDPYTNITENLKSAKIVKNESLNLQQDSVITTLVQATYKEEKQQMHPDAAISPTLYWISRDRHLVLKQVDAYTLPSQRSSDSVRVTETTTVSNFKINPAFASATFKFEQPENARRVNEISIGGASGSSMEGREAPAFSLNNLSGRKISLQDFRGKIVLLDFWATWCAPCRRAHPDIQELYEEYKDDGLVVLGINNEGRQTAQQYMQKNDYTFTTLLDTTDSVAREYNVSAMPYYFVINREGDITSEIMGYHPKSYMLQALKEAGLGAE